MTPGKRKVGEGNRIPSYCLLCSSKCTSNNYSGLKKRARLVDFGVNILGGEGCPELGNRLEEMFVLLKVLEVPREWCEQVLLQLEEGDSGWFSVCGECTDKSLVRAWEICQKILVLEGELASVRREVKERMRRGIDKLRNKNWLEDGTVDYQIRKLLFPDLFLKSEVATFDDDRDHEPDEDYLDPDFDDSYHLNDDIYSNSGDNDISKLNSSESDFANESDASNNSDFKVPKKSKKKAKKQGPAGPSSEPKNKKPRRSHWMLCLACNSRFDTLAEYDTHRVAHETLTEFICPLCTFPAETAEELTAHKNLLHKNGTQPTIKKIPIKGHNCPKCPLRAKTWKDLKQHVDLQHASMTEEELNAAGLSLKCPLCEGKQFGSLIQLINHRRKVHPELYKKRTPTAAPTTPRDRRIYQRWKICQKCDSRYKTKLEFDAHLKAHEEAGQEFTCVQCTFPATTQEELDKHNRSRHENLLGPQRQPKKTYDCPKCPLRTETWKYLKQHVSEDHPSVTPDELIAAGLLLKCDLCEGRQFESIQRLTLHRRTVHPELDNDEEGEIFEPCVCPTCGQKFASKNLLHLHVRNTHKRKSKLICDQCGKGFKSKSELDYHKTYHFDQTQTQPICHLCGLDFANDKTLNQHYISCHPPESSTSTEKLLQCRYCDLTTTFSAVLKRHQATHKEEMGFHCDQCEKSYANAQGLSRHVRISHSSESWPCPYCSKVFPCEEYMKDHIRKYCQLKRLQEKKMLG